MEPELADLERVYASLNIPGHRVELLDGQVTVSPTASRQHSRIVHWMLSVCWRNPATWYARRAGVRPSSFCLVKH